MSYGDRSNIFVTCPGACKQNPKYDTARPSCFPRWPPRAHNLSDNSKSVCYKVHFSQRNMYDPIFRGVLYSTYAGGHFVFQNGRHLGVFLLKTPVLNVARRSF